MFAKLGEGLSAIQHVVSYWRYRFPTGCRSGVDPAEFLEILEDFLGVLRGFDHAVDEQRDTQELKVLLV